MAAPADELDFDVQNRKEIVFILEDLVKYQAVINLRTLEGVGFLTSVLEVSPEAGCLYLDISQDSLLNEQVIKSQRVTFSLQVGIRVRWRSAQVRLVSLPDGDAFEIEIPEVVERIQRREYYRLGVTPDSDELICKIPLSGSNVLVAAVEDMSVGGIAIVMSEDPPKIFSQGLVLQGCSINFPDAGVVPLSLKIRSIRMSSASRNVAKEYHIGFEFVGLSRSASIVVQRHMIQLAKDQARAEE